MKKIEAYLTMSLIPLVLFAHAVGMCPNHQGSEGSAQTLDVAAKGLIIEEMARLVEERYVFPDIAEKIVEYIRHRHRERVYDHITTIPDFLQQLTKDMRSINDDAHLGVIPRRGPIKEGISPEEMYRDIFLKRGPFQNFGFKKAERLLGNVGCLVLDEFSYVEMDGENVGGETARAAMQVISNSNALIIDLRDNFGGREEMALLLLDYFFREPVHLLSNRYRGRDDTEIWTRGEKAGGRLAEIPLFVLTSRHTVSGGEMFTYVLKNRKRATIIGEKTRGSAHRTHLFSLQSAAIDIAIPVGTTIDPVTGTDWEGKGIEPDLEVPSGKAMDVAYKNSLEIIMQSDLDASEKQEIQWALMEVDARLNPITLDKESLQDFVGIYGERKISEENGSLYYQRAGQPVFELKPMTKDLFSFADKGMFYVRIKFSRNESGVIEKMILLYDTGRRDEISKTSDRVNMNTINTI